MNTELNVELLYATVGLIYLVFLCIGLSRFLEWLFETISRLIERSKQ